VNGPQSPRQNWTPGAIALWIAVFLVANLVMPAAIEASETVEIAMVLVGSIAGQLGLLAIWAVFGPQRLLVRWPIALLVTASLYGAFLLGIVWTEAPEWVLRDLAKGLLMLPLIFLAVQFPLWVLRIVTGWCIVAGGREDDSSSTESRQFGLQHMLGATAAVAAALGLARLGLPGLDNRGGSADPSQWKSLMFVCLMFSVWSASSTLPCVWAAFVARSKAAGAVVIAVYVVLMSVLAVVVVSAIGGPPLLFGEVVKIFLLLHGPLALVLLGSLHLARACGYTLLRPGRMHPPAVPTGTSPFADSSEQAPSAAPNDVETEANP
jgi:hypothetical protein